MQPGSPYISLLFRMSVNSFTVSSPLFEMMNYFSLLTKYHFSRIRASKKAAYSKNDRRRPFLVFLWNFSLIESSFIVEGILEINGGYYGSEDSYTV
jgi:hypothetical protein